MHEHMQYDPIQDQSQGHEPFQVGNPAIFSCASYNWSWQLTTDS